MLITPFDPWKSKQCTCPQKFSLSAYVGCSHNCLYCYASSYIRNFFSVRAKKDFLERLKREINKLPEDIYITMANSSDPYLHLEKRLKLTQKTLKILKEYRKIKVMLVTKSSLILRDLFLLKDFSHIIVSISLTTLDEKLAQKLEPCASPVRDRLKTIEKLSQFIPVVCRIDPLIYPLTIKEVEKTVKEVKERGARQIIVSTYKVRRDNLKRMIRRFPQYKELWYRLYFKEGERIGGYFYLSFSLRKKIIEEARDICLREKIDFSSCRENLAYLNTKICDGSSFF